MKKYNKKLHYHVQTIIKGIYFEKIGILPAKFGIFNWNDLNMLYHYSNTRYKYKKYRYSENELINAYFHPAILHVVIKPWKKINNYAKEIWLQYAKKTNYYKEICNKYKICNENEL